jgi:hypothetical protein
VVGFSASGLTLKVQEDRFDPAAGYDEINNQTFVITPDPAGGSPRPTPLEVHHAVHGEAGVQVHGGVPPRLDGRDAGRLGRTAGPDGWAGRLREV